MKQKQSIAAGIEKILLDLNHPEMPKERPFFKLLVGGTQAWSWADIAPNWTFDENHKPGINPHNERVAKLMNADRKES
jgi:hypothetical protein